MANEWPRRAIGKLVRSSDGSIQGSDYTTTARSAHPPFPNVGDAVGFPALGIIGQVRWADYPSTWAEGGFYLRPKMADGMVYLIASRARAYPEHPGKPNSPDFVETVHAAHPVETLNFPTLFQLPAHLVPKPLTEVNKDYPPLELKDVGPVRLPSGWFADSRAMLAAVAGGATLDARDPMLSVDEFFKRALLAVACLPGAIRWRVAIASGVYAVPPADKAGVLYALALSFQPRGSAGSVANLAGEAYAKWFEEATKSGDRCVTVQDISQVVDAKFPTLSRWDALPTGEGWGIAVKALAEIQRFEELKAWIRTGDGVVPSLDDFHYLRPDILDLTDSLLDGPAIARDFLLSGVVGSDWKPDWSGYIPDTGAPPTRMAVVGQLLGTLSPLDPVAIAKMLDEPPFDLPSGLKGDIGSRLSTALDAASGGAGLVEWVELLRRAFRDKSPAWFASWVEANSNKLLWRAVRLGFANPTIDVTESWDSERFPGPRAVRALLRHQRPDRAAFEALLRGMSDSDTQTVRRLVEHVTTTLPELAIRLAMAAGFNSWLSEWIRREVLERKDKSCIKALATVAGSMKKLERVLAEGLMWAWEMLSPVEQTTIRPKLRPDLGPLDSILFDDNPQLTNEPVADWVWPVAWTLCQAEAHRRRNVLLAACRRPNFVTHDFQTNLLNPILLGGDIASIAPKSCLSLRFTLDILENRVSSYPIFIDDELNSAPLWLPLLAGLPEKRRAPILGRLDQLPVAIQYGSSLQPFPPNGDRIFWSEWLRMIATDRRERYLNYVKAAGVENEPLWRFAAGWGRIDKVLTEREADLIIDHDLVEEYLRSVLIGAPLEEEISRRIDRRKISNVCLTVEQCRTLYERCQELGDEMAAVGFWKHCRQTMSNAEREALDREVSRGLLSQFLNNVTERVLGRHAASEGWLGLARYIYKSSSDNVRGKLNPAIRPRRNS